jgi:thiamine pyrophosphokinase
MSSHHIVREKQEPALLVLDMDNFPSEQLGQLLEWSPTVIAAMAPAEKLHSLGIKIDWVISNGEGLALQADLYLLNAGDGNPAETALKFLIANSYPAVNIITNSFAPEDYGFYADKINLVIFCNNRKIFAVHSKFSKWKAAGETIELLTPVNNFHFNGLEKIGDYRYKTTNDGFFSMFFDPPFLFIAERL